MAIYHFSAQIIGRSAGRSAVAAAAYRAGDKLRDERTGKVHNYGRKRGIVHTEIMAPAKAAAWIVDRAQLWNKVEAGEKRKDAQLAREIDIALPVELDRQQQLDLVREFVQSQFVKKGMVADVAIHDTDGTNPHVHIMLTMRKLEGDGFGNKVRAWNDNKLLEQWRKAWADCANAALERAGVDVRIDHRSLKDQGIEREPQIHVGVKSWHAKQRKGIETPRYKRFKEILKRNEIYVQLAEVDDALKAAEHQPQHSKADLSSVALELEQQQEQNRLMVLQRKLHALEQQRDEVVRKARLLAEEAYTLSAEASTMRNRAQLLADAHKRYLAAREEFKAAEAAANTPWQRFLATIGIKTHVAIERDNARTMRQCAWRDLVQELGFKPQNTKQVRAEIEALTQEADALSGKAEVKRREAAKVSVEISTMDEQIREISAEIYELERDLEPALTTPQRQQDRGWELEM